MEGIPFLVSDESINTYGFRVLTEGIMLDDFLKNPVGLYQHIRSSDNSATPLLPICRWENVRRVGTELFADAVFDSDDPFARTIANKVRNGFLKAVSIGINIIDLSEDLSVMLPGQTMPTITKSELKEISIVDIGGNKNAVKLYDNEKLTTISEAKLSFRVNGQTEYERLWKSNGLENLKLSNPTKFALLQKEWLDNRSHGVQTKNVSKVSVRDNPSLSFSDITNGHDEYVKLWKGNRLEGLKKNSPTRYEHLLSCYKQYRKS